jgi:peroxiredoxin
MDCSNPQLAFRMNYRVLLLGIALCALMVSSCSDDERYFSLKGQIEGMPEQLITLEEEGISDIKIIDTVRSSKDGSFKLKGIYREPGIYKLRLSDQVLPVVIDGTDISISGNWDRLQQSYTATGSSGTASIINFNRHYYQEAEKLAGLKIATDSLLANHMPDSIIMDAQVQLQNGVGELVKFVKNYADTTHSFPVAYYTVLHLPGSEEQYVRNFGATLDKRFPNNKLATEFSAMVKKMPVTQMEEGLRIGQQAPDFTYADLSGNKVSLSSFKGKYVLLDFWASWCPPCRAENPSVVAAFHKFKNKNFTILSVSLDKDKAKWQEAVKKDGLVWTNVSELKEWQSSVVASYGFQSIPSNFLLDPEGKIIAKDLRGAALEETLNAVFGAE